MPKPKKTKKTVRVWAVLDDGYLARVWDGSIFSRGIFDYKVTASKYASQLETVTGHAIKFPVVPVTITFTTPSKK